MVRRLVFALGLGLVPSAFAAPPIGYAQATNYFKKDQRPTLYQPLNLLDNREVTAWCASTADHLQDTLTFGFKGPVKIDEVRVYTGNGFDDKTFGEFAKAKKLSLKATSGSTTVTFTLANQRGLQAIQINPPLSGENFLMDVRDQYPADDPEMPVCITDIVFYSDGKPLNGSWLTQKLKYDRQNAPLMGTWYGGYEGAADKFLSFYFDETYHYAYEPYDPANKAKVFSGSYSVNGNRITLDVPGKGKVSLQLHREKQTDAQGNVKRGLKLEGAELPADLKDNFRDAP